MITPALTAEGRFRRLAEPITETGCWIWMGWVDRKGYGRFKDEEGNTRLAYRWAFEHWREPIPAGLTLDHLCCVPECANPWHLEPVTNRTNSLRSASTVASRNLAKTKCPNGHNYIAAVEGGRDRRRCPVCQRLAVRDCMRRKRAQVS